MTRSALSSLASGLKDAIACESAIYDTRFAFDYYRPLKDSRILWGGRISILDRGPEAIAKLLKADLVTVYPQLEDVNIDYSWGGLMSYGRQQTGNTKGTGQAKLPEPCRYGQPVGDGIGEHLAGHRGGRHAVAAETYRMPDAVVVLADLAI